MHTTHSLFEEPYWLDAVAPGMWSAVEVHDGPDLIGRLPFVTKRYVGFDSVTRPILTPWLGPWVATKPGKYCNQLSFQHRVLKELIQQLPHAAGQFIRCAPEFTNLMAFHWEGFDLGVSYTYRIVDASDPKSLWRQFRENVRRECKKAEKSVEVCVDEDLPALFRCIQDTFQR